jgi:hypothetical protein
MYSLDVAYQSSSIVVQPRNHWLERFRGLLGDSRVEMITEQVTRVGRFRNDFGKAVGVTESMYGILVRPLYRFFIGLRGPK